MTDFDDWDDPWRFAPKEWLTNAPPERRAVYEAAIKESGFDIYVGKAMSRPGYTPPDDDIGLYTNERGRDHRSFWAIVERLEMRS